jgi:YggT family protein
LNDQIAGIFTLFLYVLIGLIVARSVISFIPSRPDNAITRFIYQATEPMLQPIRRLLPKTGMIDFSSMVVIVLLYVMVAVVNQAASS